MGIMEGFKHRFDYQNGVEVLLPESSYEMVNSQTMTYGWNPLVVAMDNDRIKNFVQRMGKTSGSFNGVGFRVRTDGCVNFYGGHGNQIAGLL